MRAITKGAEPRELTHYRSQPHAYFDGAPKESLRLALAKEQGYLCAYCMRRIKATHNGMKIEHFRAQDTHPELALSYRNMLGVCNGGEGQERNLQHCDSHKGNRAITIDPLDKPERFIRYLNDGSIISDNDSIWADLDTTLNLNITTLRRDRKAAWDGVYGALKRLGDDGFREGTLRRKIAKLREKSSDGMYSEYCGMVLYFLAKKLRKVAARKGK